MDKILVLGDKENFKAKSGPFQYFDGDKGPSLWKIEIILIDSIISTAEEFLIRGNIARTLALFFR
ncbi:MAG: hypothetical protein Q4G68_06110 [Planctomycetia bacterium]|nr:hypothetical protein [Planctomycetia bacterium]